MPFTKNDKNINTKGRKPNSLNRNTAVLKELITDTIQDNYSTFLERLNALNDKEYINAYISLLRYVLPTLKATEVKEQKINDYNNADKIEIEIITNNQNK